MDLFTSIKETLRLHALREYTTDELIAEIKRRTSMSDTPEIIYEDDYIEVLAVDEKGTGGAHHVYHIRRRPSDAEVYDEYST